MNDPQIWTLLGVFSAMMFTALGISTRYTVSTLRAEIRGVDAKHDGRADAFGARIDALADRMEAGFATALARHEALADRMEAGFAAALARDEALGAQMDAGFAASHERDEALRARIDDLTAQMTAGFAAAEERIDAKIDHLAEVVGIQIGSVNHRLGNVEDDLKIVKAHLLRHPAA